MFKKGKRVIYFRMVLTIPVGDVGFFPERIKDGSVLGEFSDGHGGGMMERTLSIIKPDAVSRGVMG